MDLLEASEYGYVHLVPCYNCVLDKTMTNVDMGICESCNKTTYICFKCITLFEEIIHTGCEGKFKPVPISML